MRILVVTPAPPGSRTGNRVTALRWARLLRDLGHHVTVATAYGRHDCELLVALHARKSAESVARFRKDRPDAPVVLGLTGTDVYRDIHDDPSAQRSLELADRYVVLQPLAVHQLPAELHARTHVAYQSVVVPRSRHVPASDRFEVALLAHLRAVKDPLRAAAAARLLPASSRLTVVHAGAVLDARLGRRAEEETATNPRYHWVGEVRHDAALRLLARVRLLVLTSLSEGGANVVSEAIAVGTPVVSSRVDGSVGVLGPDYPGYFPPGDTEALAGLLHRAESDPAFLDDLRRCCEGLAPLVHPDRERDTWAEVLAGLHETGRS